MKKYIILLVTFFLITRCNSKKEQESNCYNNAVVYAIFETNQDTINKNQDLEIILKMNDDFNCLKENNWKIIGFESTFYSSINHEEKYPFRKNLKSFINFKQEDSLKNEFCRVDINQENLKEIKEKEFLFYVGRVKIYNEINKRDSTFTAIIRW